MNGRLKRAGSTSGALGYCAAELRRQDNDRFLTALAAPPSHREGLFALYAFNAEIAKTRDVVTEPIIGQMRLQWWRDAIDKAAAGEVLKHEVVSAMAPLVTQPGVDPADFSCLIDAREHDLDPDGFAAETDFEAYVTATSMPLGRLAVRALGLEDTAATQAAELAARAYARMGVLRSVGHLARTRRTLLPRDLLERHGVGDGDLFELRSTTGLRTLARAVGEAAGRDIGAARALRPRVPKPALAAMLPASLAELYLQSLDRHGHDPLAAGFVRPHPARARMIAWRGLLGRF